MLPPTIPIFPLPNAVLFPSVFMPLHIFEARYRAMVADAMAGDRIIGLRQPGKGVEVHAIDCLALADGVDADWLDLSWGDRTTGAIGRLRLVLYNRPGTLAEVTGILASNHANVVNLQMVQRDDPFGTYEVDLEVTDLAHLARIVSSLRACDAVAEAERI